MEQDTYFLEPQILKSISILELSTQPVTYGVGIIYEDNSIIIKNKLYKTPIKRYLIIKDNIDFEQSQNLLHLEEDHLEVIELDNDQLTKNMGQFSQVFLNFEPKHKYLSSQMYEEDDETITSKKEINYGLILGIQTSQKSLVSIFKRQFYGNVKLSDFQFEQGLIFIEKSSNQYVFYGFCHQMRQYAYNIEFIALGSNVNQAISSTSLTIKPVSSVAEFPYNSVGLLITQKGGKGTAQILFNPKDRTCKFLITCAHNFLNLQPSKIQKLGIDYRQDNIYTGYKFVYCNKFVQKTLNFLSCSSDETLLAIKKVHFPSKLTEYFKYAQELKYKKNAKKYKYKIKQSKVGNQKATYQVPYQSIYDIAIIELEEAFPISNGFRLRYTPKQTTVKDNIEIVGFPMSSQTINTTIGVMYHQYAGFHPKEEDSISIMRLEDNLQVIQHKLASLPGNSGSPIFQNVGKDQAYLFGIHTSGRGQAYIASQQQVTQNQRQIYGTHNLGTYIYNKDVFDWIKTIPGIQTVIDRTTFVYTIGIIEALANDKQTYLIGVFDTNYSILTLARYFQKKTYKPKRVYIKNSKVYDVNLYKFDLSNNQPLDCFQTQETFQPTSNKKIVRILLTNKIQSNQFPDNFAKKTTQEQYQSTIFSSGFLVRLGNQIQNGLELNQVSFTTGLPRLQTTGALFVRNQQGQICFDGFYDNDSEQELKQGAYVSIHENNFQNIKRYVLAELQKDITKFPYNSIGMLIKDEKDNQKCCTASILYNEIGQQSRFLITCAIAFYSQDLETNQFYYVNGGTLGQKPQMLKIKKIHIPNEYENYSQYFDVALVQLQQPLKVDYGFQILRQEKSIQVLDFDHIELAGFPHVQQAKMHGELYYDTSKNLPYNVLMIKQQKIQEQTFKYINHRFNTMLGHAGSAIFENTEGGKSYLMGIHNGKDDIDPNSIVQTNRATYLYNQKVWQWLRSIPGLYGYFTD